MKRSIYKGGYAYLVRQFDEKRSPLTNVEAVLPPADVDLHTLSQTIVSLPQSCQYDQLHDARRKYHDLASELVGQSQLVLLHAFVISVMRRRDFPKEAADMFFRIWTDIGSEFVKSLPVRWQISAATTFAEHGQNGTQRACGMGLSMLFDLIRLHDTERRLSGIACDAPFARAKGANQIKLAFDVHPVGLLRGDVDKNMLARLWLMSEEDKTICPLAQHMLWQAIQDERTIFARILKVKQARKKKHAETVSISGPNGQSDEI